MRRIQVVLRQPADTNQCPATPPGPKQTNPPTANPGKWRPRCPTGRKKEGGADRKMGDKKIGADAGIFRQKYLTRLYGRKCLQNDLEKDDYIRIGRFIILHIIILLNLFVKRK